MKLQLVWGQLQPLYPTLSALMIKLFPSPASIAGIERHHKVGKRALNSKRCRLGDGKVERHFFVAHMKNNGVVQAWVRQNVTTLKCLCLFLVRSLLFRTLS